MCFLSSRFINRNDCDFSRHCPKFFFSGHQSYSLKLLRWANEATKTKEKNLTNKRKVKSIKKRKTHFVVHDGIDDDDKDSMDADYSQGKDAKNTKKVNKDRDLLLMLSD